MEQEELSAQQHLDIAAQKMRYGELRAAQVHATLAVAAALIEQNANIARCGHGVTGICMTCVLVNDLMRPRS